jgi:hypothetical protein
MTDDRDEQVFVCEVDESAGLRDEQRELTLVRLGDVGSIPGLAFYRVEEETR